MQRIIVDPEYQYLLSKYKWWIKSNGYVTARIDGKFILLHRLIMKAKDEEEIDHKNRNKADNRKSNLKVSTRVENMRNVDYQPGKSGIVGVTFHTQNKNWIARIRNGKTRIHLGSFSTKKEAAFAYQSALQQL